MHAVRALHSGGTLAEKTAIQERRRKLQARVNGFHRSADAFYSVLDDDDLQPDNGREFHDEEGLGADFEDDDGEVPLNAESVRLRMPSNVIVSLADGSQELKKLANHELKLRQGQANDALQKLRLAIGQKSLALRGQVRRARSNATRTRAWADVEGVEGKIKEQADIYRLARAALPRLSASEDTLTIYEILDDEHLIVPKDLTEENRTGQRSDTLSWIWRLDGQHVAEGDDWMKECMFFSIICFKH